LLNSFEGFLSVIKPTKTISIDYNGLYNGMKHQNGWGEKTSALFSKIAVSIVFIKSLSLLIILSAFAVFSELSAVAILY